MRNQKRRKIPILNISLKGNASYSQLCEIPEVRKLVMQTTIDAIAEGIKKNKKSTILFEIANCEYLIELEKSQWISSLEKTIEYYIEIEDYDACACARDLIKQIK